jgi:hypothetical protein
MKDVQHADGGGGSDDHDRCQIESKAEQHQHDSRAHTPPDRMDHHPVTEPARKAAHHDYEGRTHGAQSARNAAVMSAVFGAYG